MKTVPLMQVCDFQGGTQPPRNEWSNQPKAGYVRMLQIRDFTQGKESDIAYVKDNESLKKCEESDIMIGRYGASIGKILTGLSGAYNVALVKTIPNEDKLTKSYLYYYLNSVEFQNFIKNIGSRAAQAGFNKTELRSLKIPLPSPDQQQHLAYLLDRADALRRKRQEALALLDELGRSVFLEMFGDPALNPKGWDKKTLSKVFSKKKHPIKTGPFGSALKKEEYVKQGIPAWTMDSIQDNRFVKEGCLFITEAKYRELESYFVENGDILISRAGTVGKMCVVEGAPEKSIITSNLMRLSLNHDEMQPLCFTCLMSWFSNRVSRLKVGGDEAYSFVNTTVLENLKIPVPDKSKQDEFVKILNGIEVLKDKESVHLQESETLFQSLLHRAMRGEVEVSETVFKKLKKEDAIKEAMKPLSEQIAAIGKQSASITEAVRQVTQPIAEQLKRMPMLFQPPAGLSAFQGFLQKKIFDIPQPPFLEAMERIRQLSQPFKDIGARWNEISEALEAYADSKAYKFYSFLFEHFSEKNQFTFNELANAAEGKTDLTYDEMKELLFEFVEELDLDQAFEKVAGQKENGEQTEEWQIVFQTPNYQPVTP